MLTEAEITVLFRTLLAALLGLAIGWERRAVGAPVRGRIITLTTMTSAAVTAVGVEIYTTQASRIVAGIVTGIGFLGAGVIMRSSTGEVRGQATAAALWAMSCIGIIVVTRACDSWRHSHAYGLFDHCLGCMADLTRLNQRLNKRKTKDVESQQTNETDKPDE